MFMIIDVGFQLYNISYVRLPSGLKPRITKSAILRFPPTAREVRQVIRKLASVVVHSPHGGGRLSMKGSIPSMLYSLARTLGTADAIDKKETNNSIHMVSLLYDIWLLSSELYVKT